MLVHNSNDKIIDCVHFGFLVISMQLEAIYKGANFSSVYH